VTFAYVTDVYILEKYRGKGLGGWLMECVKATLDTWPELRRTILMTNDKQGQAFYKKFLDMDPYPQGSNGHVVLTRKYLPYSGAT
jgi:GNAT superfamily N-acetyltransferase